MLERIIENEGLDEINHIAEFEDENQQMQLPAETSNNQEQQRRARLEQYQSPLADVEINDGERNSP